MIQWTTEQFGELREWMGRIEARVTSIEEKIDRRNGRRLPVYVIPGGSLGAGVGLASWAIAKLIGG